MKCSKWDTSVVRLFLSCYTAAQIHKMWLGMQRTQKYSCLFTCLDIEKSSQSTNVQAETLSYTAVGCHQ
eukprot:2970795-Amphidinium_carterae.1